MGYIISILLFLVRRKKYRRKTIGGRIVGAVLGVVVVIVAGKILIPEITLWQIMKIIVRGQIIGLNYFKKI